MFDEQTSAERDRQLRLWLLVSLTFYWLKFALDFVAVPDAIWISFVARLCLMTPLVCAAILLLPHARPGWRKSAVVIMSPFLCTLLQLGIFAASSRVDTLLDGLFLGLEVLWINVLFPMRLRETVLFSILTMTLGDIINVWSAEWHHTPVVSNASVAVHCLVLLSLLGRAVAEQNMRRSFLQGLKLKLHVEDLSRANIKLLEISHTDPLTGIANRRFFDRILDQAWRTARECGTSIALMMIDVDHFKLFNDTAGHPEGDRCLVTIARTIDGQTRTGQDTVARFGGEEFVVLMPNTDAELAAQIAERVRAAISAQRVFHPAHTASGFVSVSIGVASLRPSQGHTGPSGLIAAADKALYAAKAAGRDQVAYAAA